MHRQDIRQPAVAGLFYPDSPDEISRQIEDYLEKASKPETLGQNILGGVVPHAGYRYSGGVAAYTYKILAQKQPSTIFIVGPSHREHFESISIYPGTGLETPLGTVPIDTDLADIFTEHPDVIYSDRGYTQEHALEVQLPFLQKVMTQNFRVLPLAMGSQASDLVLELAELMHHHWKSDMMLLASSDLSHFYRYDKAQVMDAKFQELVKKMDIDGLWSALNRHEIEACGFGPVMVLLELARLQGNCKTHILHYANSGDVTGDRDKVVGYMAAIIEQLNDE